MVFGHRARGTCREESSAWAYQECSPGDAAWETSCGIEGTAQYVDLHQRPLECRKTMQSLRHTPMEITVASHLQALRNLSVHRA